MGTDVGERRDFIAEVSMIVAAKAYLMRAGSVTFRDCRSLLAAGQFLPANSAAVCFGYVFSRKTAARLHCYPFVTGLRLRLNDQPENAL